MKIKTLLLLLIAFSFFSNFRCEEDTEPPCEGENNVARLDVKVLPNQKEYLIGDTIWLTTSFDTDLELTNGQSSVSLDTASGSIVITIFKIMSGQVEVASGFDDFDIVNRDGLLKQYLDSNYDKRYSGSITFNCSLDSCGFEVGIVPRLSGTYALLLALGSAYVNSDQMSCGLLNRFRDNTFVVDDYNEELLNELGINGWLEETGGSGITSYIQILDNPGAHVFKVN